MQPTINDLTTFDAAVLLEKAILLNGMLANGTPQQKAKAKQFWEQLENDIRLHVNAPAFEMAKRELALDHENLEVEHFSLFDNKD
ncbi:hypothetical protein [Viridibacillus arvi]|uniref:hypothetical protein n=1 Tax=Viridibacillus arvi TaxID=263475 RepID=UPI0034CDF356